MNKAITFDLTIDELEVLDRPLVGEGGFQRFGRKLQKLVDRKTNRITLQDADMGRILRHITYDPGGFEERLRGAFGRHLFEIATGIPQ